LPGITRDTVLTLAEQMGIRVVETVVPRELLYIADELFFSGTAAEITPIRSVDRVIVGGGKRGPITEQIQKEFFAIVRGTTPDRNKWLTPVGSRKLAEVTRLG
jgi:branched-chain amino acid aminotransferase